MRRAVTGILALVAAGGVIAGTVVVWPIGRQPAEIVLTGDVRRGAYLARAGGCIACHTNFKGRGAPLAGGAPLETQFGTFFPPNLTTDPVHGIGGWTREAFAMAVRQGVSPEGQPYYPTFTYPFYANFTDQEIADLWAAFQTVPPVGEASPDHEVPFPFDLRWTLKLWRAAFLEPPDTDPVPENGELWNRGKELVGGAAHCGACHTGRNFAGARASDTKRFQGNDNLPGGDKAPAIDLETLGKRGWDVVGLAYALKTGVTPSGDAFSGSMGEVVMQGTRFLTNKDRKAIATYLMDDHAGEAAGQGKVHGWVGDGGSVP